MTQQTGADEPRARLAGLLVLAAGLLITLAVWRSFGVHEQSEVRWATRMVTQAVRSDILTDMEWQMVGLDRLALLWQAADANPPGDLWIRNAELYLQHRPGSVAVEWVTPGGEPRAVIATNGNPNTSALAFGGLPKALLAAASESGTTVISAPAFVSGGGRQWAVVHPVSANGQARGFIVSFFDVTQSWDYILGDLKSLGFSFAVSANDQPDYLLPGSSREHEQDWGEVIDVPLPGVTWQVRVWPKPDVVHVIKSRLPEVTLAAGAALSLLIALTLYFALRATRSSARSRQANEALQREMIMREGAQEELRRAHAELEVRIDRRTADLAAANTLLQQEVSEHQRAEQLAQELTGRLFQLQDEERRRLARELHDGTAQNLVALSMNVGMVRDAIPANDVSTKELVNECIQLIEKSVSELRTLAHLLHPPYFDELGLATALRAFVDGFAARSGIEVSLELPSNLGRLGYESELAIYRIVQEALSNVYRHAHSRTAGVTLARDAESVRVEIEDAGRGLPQELLDAPSGHLVGVGIAGMRERVKLLGGRLDIESNCRGTRVRAVFPAALTVFAGPKLVRSGAVAAATDSRAG